MPSNVTFELTETALMENRLMLETCLMQLTELGFRISADDFGIGYSSLNRLISLPISSLKIDKTFIQSLSKHPKETTVIKSILGLAENLKLTAIAEGIETEEQLNFLIELRCRYGQGFYFAKPMLIDELEEYIKQAAVQLGPTDTNQNHIAT